MFFLHYDIPPIFFSTIKYVFDVQFPCLWFFPINFHFPFLSIKLTICSMILIDLIFILHYVSFHFLFSYLIPKIKDSIHIPLPINHDWVLLAIKFILKIYSSFKCWIKTILVSINSTLKFSSLIILLHFPNVFTKP